MPQVVFRVRAVAGRWALFSYSALVVAGCALLALPLMGTPGYELSVGLTLLLGLLGPVVGVVLGRAEQRRSPEDRSAVSATLAALGLLVAALVPPLVLSIGLTLALTPCNPFVDFAFFPVLTLPSAALAAALGVWVGLGTRRWWTAAVWLLGALGLSALDTAWPILFGPQVFAFNHLLGYVPGPLYDETLEVTPALGWFRVETLLWAAALLALAVRTEAAQATRVARRGAAWLGTVSVLLAAGLWSFGPKLGFRSTDQSVMAELGGHTETAHAELFFPSGASPGDVARLAEDVEFRIFQIEGFLKSAPPGKVRVWVYDNAAQKQRLVGAAHTQFSKPWRREVHINGLAFPHGTLKHELMHALAAPYGAPPFGVTARLLGLAPLPAVIEGLAVAGDNPVDELSLTASAAAMRRKKLLPDVRALLAPQGFYDAPAGQAYATAGAFLRWLGEARGGDKLVAVYRHGDFEAVYGQPVDALVSDWERFLDSVPLPPESVNEAARRFHEKSLFERPCAREVDALSERGFSLLGPRPAEARALFERCRTIQKDEPWHVLSLARAMRAQGRSEEAGAVLDLELKRLGGTAQWFDAAMTRADLWARLGQSSDAAALWKQVLALNPPADVERTAWIRLAALDFPPAARDAVQRYFGDERLEVQLVALRDALAATAADVNPTVDRAVLAYLLGRRLHAAKAPGDAERWLGVALAAELPAPITREATGLALDAAYAAGHCDQVRALVARAQTLGPTFALRAREWSERCDFDALRH